MGSTERKDSISITLLIDADIVAYQVASANEKRIDWGDGAVSVETDFDGAKTATRGIVENYIETLDADHVIMCLSDDLNNFRKKVDPTYKTNRTNTVRPELLYDVKDWMTEEFTFDRRDWLEADDVMGILATEEHDGQRIIVSEDKDMQTIPAWQYNPNRPMKGVFKPTPEEAERFMFWQALCGDPVDGYKGCPGVGPMAADAALMELKAKVRYEHVLKSGRRKGEVQQRYTWKTFETQWDAIIACFEFAGLNEKDAITQVNLARILKHSDYDGNRAIPWVPN